MKKITVIVLGCVGVILSGITQANCEKDSSVMTAKYRLTTVNKGVSASSTTKYLTLWRRGDEVAHQHSEFSMTEMWNQLSDGRIRPVQHFDDHQRSIEYEPGALNSGKGEDSWSKKTQLISSVQKSLMTLDRVEGEGCEKREYYSRIKGDTSFSLVWYSAKDLPLQYEEKSGTRKFTLTLKESDGSVSAVNEFFAQRASYQSTDYADIGDNESDPFLLGMINLGFVEHGASGFYNVNGENMGGEHSAHAH